ncbi:MAG: hypothetical protein H7Z74_08505 [Anaerolineae bacterium]|nr:hypothetical protein [Gemmatimonadaceae bacterium]
MREALTPDADKSPTLVKVPRYPRTASRLFLTVFVVYVAHFASNVVRETYLAITLGERLSVRVDEYLGLHPDLFAIPGRGAYINNNPGASMLGAVPYAVARPFIAGLLRIKPELARPKPVAVYNDPRPNRNRFMNEARARGLDIKLALAAASMQAGLMAPLGGLAAVVMFFFLRGRLKDERAALWLALLYAFGTPVFFRSAFLNQNVLVAHCVLVGFVLLQAYGRATVAGSERNGNRMLGFAGALAGTAVLIDYSGAPLLLAFGIWALGEGWARGGPIMAIRSGAWFTLGAAVPLAMLLGYQWAAFGDPLFPAQRYMPPTRYSVRGWNGLSAPTMELLLRNLFDPRYGLFAFCPMLIAALAAPFVKRDFWNPGRRELAFIFGASGAVYLFNSANQFALLQWNTGVRYMVPLVPLLFIALVPVLLCSPRWLLAVLVIPTLAISWSVSMARESVPESLARILNGGLELPWLTVLEKTADAYAPFLAGGASALPFFALLAALLWVIWRRGSVSV